MGLITEARMAHSGGRIRDRSLEITARKREQKKIKMFSWPIWNIRNRSKK
jgi:hypothetical protein